MKRIFYTLLAATICLSACQKENQPTVMSGEQAVSIADADFEAVKATLGSNKKKADVGIELNYALVIKEVSEHKYKVVVKMHGLKLNGQKLSAKENDDFKDAISGLVIGLNNTQKKQEEPLDIILESNDVNGDNYQFPTFEFKGDLSYEMLNVKTSFKIKDGNLTIKDKSSFTIGESIFTVSGGNIEFNGSSNFLIKEGTAITVNSEKTETNFAILLGKEGNSSSFSDDDDYYILPKGRSVEQNPELVKVNFPKDEEGMVMRITIAGDPQETVTGVYYKPAPIPNPNNPDDMIQPAAIYFEKSGEDKKVGICCYDRCVKKDKGTIVVCGTTDHFKKSDFNPNGPGWARITLKISE